MANKFCSAGYIALLLLAAIGAYRSSDRDWNWDLLANMACAVSFSESDAVRIHMMVYAAARAEVPATAYKLLTEANPYRTDLASNPLHFAEVIPFYNGKVLYVALIAGEHRLGATYINAMKLISAAGFLALGLVFFLWAQVYVRAFPAAVLSGALMLSQPILDTARIFSADALSVATITWALYLLFELGRARLAALMGMALLCLAVFVRNDTLVLAILVIGYFTVASHSPVKLKRAYGAVLIILLAGAVLALSHFGGYGWRMSFYHGLVQRVAAPAESSVPHISFFDYLRAAARSMREALDSSSLPLFVFLTAAILLLAKLESKIYHLLLLNLSFSLVRITIYPGFEERYYVSTYVIVALAFISAWAESAGPRGHAVCGREEKWTPGKSFFSLARLHFWNGSFTR